jgi:hypothetical protein
MIASESSFTSASFRKEGAFSSSFSSPSAHVGLIATSASEYIAYGFPSPVMLPERSSRYRVILKVGGSTDNGAPKILYVSGSWEEEVPEAESLIMFDGFAGLLILGEAVFTPKDEDKCKLIRAKTPLADFCGWQGRFDFRAASEAVVAKLL